MADPRLKPPPDNPFDVAEADRYDQGSLLGRGGMGEVRAVEDRRLGREVALKVLSRPSPAAEARLAREASLAARLEHPGIAPVYSAGRLPDGRLYYTMRVVRGRSLAEAIASLSTLPDRLRLMRHVLDACEAVAYAHDQGVLHRDIKPANVMIGEHGETAVVDWGLALDLAARPEPTPVGPARPPSRPGGDTWDSADTWADGAAATLDTPTAPTPAAPAAPTPSASTRELTHPGQVVGTPAYMSPEQARGELLDRRADVFTLGGLLYAVICGQPPREGGDPSAPIVPLADRRADTPPELAAIVARAMAEDRADRYRDAGELARDVAAWFEGRQVAAYEYSRWELLKRLVQAWRTPLLVGAASLVALSFAVSFGWWRTTVQRNRALEAEAAAVEARASSDRALALALDAQARVAADLGLRAEAEVLAAHRLKLGEAPEARGILARFSGQPRPSLRWQTRLPDCHRTVPDRDADRLLCLTEDALQVLDLATGQVIARREMSTQSAALSGDRVAIFDGEQVLKVWNLADDTLEAVPARWTELAPDPGRREDRLLFRARGALVHFNYATREFERVNACAGDGRAILSTESSAGVIAAVCMTDNGSRTALELLDPGGERRSLTPLSSADGLPVSMQFGEDDTLAVGTDRGRVFIARPDEPLRRVETDLPSILDLDVRGNRVAIAGSRGSVIVWDWARGHQVARLPSLTARVRWREAGGVLRVIGDRVQDWEVPALESPHLYEHDNGVSAVAISPDGRFLAGGFGDGTLRVYDRSSGGLLLEHTLPGGAVKDLTFSPSGDQLYTGNVRTADVLGFDLVTGARTLLPTQNVRRLAWTDDQLFVAPYGPGLLSWGGGDPGAPRRAWPVEREVGDLEPLADAEGLVMITQEGGVRRLDLGQGSEEPRLLRMEPAARAIAGTRRYVYLALPRSVLRLSADGETTGAANVGLDGGITELQVSPGDRWIGVGSFGGAVTLLDGQTLQPVALLRGHRTRVASIAFDQEGRWMLSSSWDGTLRVWDLSTLVYPADSLIKPIEAAWGLGLEQVLSR